MKFTDGYASNISKGVNLSTGKVTGLKSHDYHVWIERIMPVMVRGYVPEHVWRVLAELSHFFRTLCAKEVSKEVIEKLHKKAPELIVKLEKIFPPGFFYSDDTSHSAPRERGIVGGSCAKSLAVRP